ncbi:MAG: Gfo/Idh/MocA family oxidoreductase [Nitrospinae bacterium]|nr:Gfo/Idh/MocA family oxidoreductase [Nitrospinota bacterium]
MGDSGKKRLTAAVVGLGNIGFRYDLDSGPGRIFSHAKAYREHPGFELVGGVDIDEKKRADFERHTGVKAYPSFDALMKSGGRAADCVSICTPTRLHLSSLKEVHPSRAALILMEKPLAYSLDEAREMLNLSQNNYKIAVNYIRRWDPGIIGAKKTIDGGSLGPPASAQCWYSKGLFNYASHAIDLFHYFFGPERETLFIRDKGIGAEDPHLDFLLRFESFDACFQASSDEFLRLLEIDMLFERGRVKILDNGWKIQLFRARGSGDRNNGRVLEEEDLPAGQDMDRYQYNVMDGIYRSLLDGAPLASDGQSAFGTLETCVRIKEQSIRGKA